MRRPLALLLALALGAVGCQNAAPVTDPFRGARVPPPPTGSLGAPVAPAYGAPPAYPPPGTVSGAPVAPLAAPPVVSTPMPGPTTSPAAINSPPVYQPPAPQPVYAQPPAAGGSGPPYAPQGGWGPPQSSREMPESLKDNLTLGSDARPLAETVRAGRLSNAAGRAPFDGDAAPGEHSSPPTDLDETAATQPLRTVRVSRDIEPVSYQAPVTTPPRTVRGLYGNTNGDVAGSNAAPTTQSANRATTAAAARRPVDSGATYGFDGQYAWLQGQLEYSESARQWKLRYIPIDGATDRYGGSVVLAPSGTLSGYRPGDFVSVKGRIDASRTAQGSFAPQYVVASVDRLSN